ncbi:MAG: hypothetical protein GTO24_28470 [candidate division Zixibacteria bacterium]|nr:hypothetical protein [candidate division Zixibacteria bacterium]
MRNSGNLFTVCIFVVALLLASPISLSSAEFVTEDGKGHHVQTIEIGNIEYVSVNELSSLLDAEVYWYRLLRKVVLEFDDHQLVFTWFSPYLLYDSEVYNLTYEVKPKDGTLYIPLKGFQRIWSYIHAPTALEQPAATGLRVDILDLEITEKVNGILVEIFTSQPVEYEVFANQNRDLNINFYQGRLDAEFFNKKKAPKFATWIKAYQFENSAQLSLRLRKPFVNLTHNLKTDPYRIQVSLIHTPSYGDSATQSLSYIPTEKEKLSEDLVDVIVIDPGHGGEDFGAVGKSGLSEKEVTLDVARRLRDLLEKEKGLQVVLTRERDVLVSLEERAQTANRNDADLFISIHTNSSKKRAVRGSETFFLASAETDEARAVAALENSSIRFDYPDEEDLNLDDLNFILMDLIQNEYLKESSDLAAMVEKNFQKRLPIPSRGVSQAGFVVLNKAYMPAVLVEVGFISNKKDEKMLKKSSFRQDVAQSLYQSIKEFKKKYESMK